MVLFWTLGGNVGRVLGTINTEIRPSGQEFAMKTISVQQHKRSPKGSREAALKELAEKGVGQSVAERVVKVATAQYAMKSYQWATSSAQLVYRSLGNSKLASSSNVAYFLLLSVWRCVIEASTSKYQSGFTDEQWCRLWNQTLGDLGLRLPFDSRRASLKILKGAMLLLPSTL